MSRDFKVSKVTGGARPREVSSKKNEGTTTSSSTVQEDLNEMKRTVENYMKKGRGTTCSSTKAAAEVEEGEGEDERERNLEGDAGG